MATSTVYLIRSMGTIYGVTITSAIVQNVLLARLPGVLGDAASEEVRRSNRSPTLFGTVVLTPRTAHRETAQVPVRHPGTPAASGGCGSGAVRRRAEDRIRGIERICAVVFLVFLGSQDRADGEEVRGAICCAGS